jgi:hypothetical protein
MQSLSRRFGMSAYALRAFLIAAALAKKLRRGAPTAIVLDSISKTVGFRN